MSSAYVLPLVARMLGETLDLLEIVTANSDNLDEGSMLTIWTGDGDEDSITALTGDGVDSLREFLEDVRTWPAGIRGFLEDCGEDPETIERIMRDEAKSSE